MTMLRQTAAMKNEHGFTLIETMVAVALIGILSGIGITGWRTWQAQQRLWQTALQVRHFLEMLRDDANWHNRERLILASRSEDAWCLHTQELQTSCSIDSPYLMRPVWPEVNLVEITPLLGFYGLRNTAWGGHIRVASDAGEWRIVVSGWGRIRMCQGAADESC
jgi:prepilin peptidase dependent protein A